MLALPLRLPTASYGGHMGHFLLSMLMLSGSAPFGNSAPYGRGDGGGSEGSYCGRESHTLTHTLGPIRRSFFACVLHIDQHVSCGDRAALLPRGLSYL